MCPMKTNYFVPDKRVSSSEGGTFQGRSGEKSAAPIVTSLSAPKPLSILTSRKIVPKMGFQL